MKVIPSHSSPRRLWDRAVRTKPEPAYPYADTEHEEHQAPGVEQLVHPGQLVVTAVSTGFHSAKPDGLWQEPDPQPAFEPTARCGKPVLDGFECEVNRTKDNSSLLPIRSGNRPVRHPMPCSATAAILSGPSESMDSHRVVWATERARHTATVVTLDQR